MVVPIITITSYRKSPCFGTSLLLLGLFLSLTSQSVSLGLDAFLSSLTGSLGLRTFGIHFFLEDSLTLLLGLGLVDLSRIVSLQGGSRGKEVVVIRVRPKHACA